MFEQSTNQEVLAAWRSGNQQAAAVLVDRYLARLTALVRARLSRRLARRIDPEDVVLSAWRSFFVAASRPEVQPADDDELWPLLATIALRKLHRQVARQTAARRTINREVAASPSAMADWFAAEEPGPDEAALVADEVEALLETIDPADREIVVRRLRGESADQIAAELGCSDRTVRRVMERVRQLIAVRSQGGDSPAAQSLRETIPTAGQIDPTPNTHADIIAAPGNRIPFSDLLLREMIGEGGFGKVYRAVHRPSGDDVAVKFLRKRFWSDRRAVQTLLSEAAILWSLSEPSLVAGRGWGRTSYGAVFLVMERIEGQDLAAWVRTESPSLHQKVAAVVEAARAVAVAHAHGILHCDLKPSNVMRRSDGRIVLTDFGFARQIGADWNQLAAGGTAAFLAPEQISDAFGTIGPRTDVYGLGALLYALLTGRPPVTGCDVPEVLARVLSSEARPPMSAVQPDIPPALDEVAARALSHEPAARFASAAAFASALNEWLQLPQLP